MKETPKKTGTTRTTRTTRSSVGTNSTRVAPKTGTARTGTAKAGATKTGTAKKASPAGNPTRARKPKRRKKKYGRVILLVLLLLAICVGGAYAYISSLVSKISRDDVVPKTVSITEPVNVLLLGVDAGNYDSKSKDSPKRSDTMMVVRYVPKTNEVYMLSLPRDTRVKIGSKYQKLNAAHAIGGPELTIKTIEQMIGIHINYYVSIDYEGFRKCIDAIGGVDVVVPHDMHYDAYDISIHFNKGEKVHLDGKRAEEFVRWRKNNDGTGYAMGDIGRIGTQQEFLVNVVSKLKSPSTIIKLPKIIDTIASYCKTNLSGKEIMSYAMKLKDINMTEMKREMLAGVPKYIGGVSYYIYDEDKSSKFISNFKNFSTTDNVDKSKIKVVVLNATKVKGLAAKYSDILKKQGYDVVRIGNYGETVEETKINDYSIDKLGAIVKDDLGIGSLEPKKIENTEADIVVVLGKDSVND